jgi:nitric oxide synthase oxygenase domain/subunit
MCKDKYVRYHWYIAKSYYAGQHSAENARATKLTSRTSNELMFTDHAMILINLMIPRTFNEEGLTLANHVTSSGNFTTSRLPRATSPRQALRTNNQPYSFFSSISC